MAYRIGVSTIRDEYPKELEDYQGPFDVVLLRLIHKRLFGDLYS